MEEYHDKVLYQWLQRCKGMHPYRTQLYIQINSDYRQVHMIPDIQHRNNLIHMLAGTTWGTKQNAQTLRSSALALCYSVVECCAPVCRNSAHTSLIDVQLDNTMRTITGAVRCSRTDWLPVLSNIAPPDIRREAATSRFGP